MVWLRDACNLELCANPAFRNDNVSAIALWFGLFFDSFLATDQKHVIVFDVKCDITHCLYHVFVMYEYEDCGAEIILFHIRSYQNKPNSVTVTLPFDVCEVTFVASSALKEIRESTGIDLTDGRHRRNVVLRDGDVHDLLNCRFELGDATFEGTRPRPPCRHVEDVAGEAGVARALGDGRGGICARVDDPGELRVGDEIGDVEELGNFEGLVANIRDRVGR